MEESVRFRELGIRTLRETVTRGMICFVVWCIHINESRRIFNSVFPVPVPAHAEDLIDEPHVTRSVKVKDLSKLLKRRHEHLLNHILQLRDRRLVRQRGI